MGLYLIKTEKCSRTKCVLNVDNQAALTAIKSKMNKSGQHLTAELLKITKQLTENRGNKQFQLTFRWSAGHVGITGNEDTDKEAKAAADGESSDKQDLPPCLRKRIRHSLLAIHQAQNETLKRKWTAAWHNSPRFKRLYFKDLLTPYSQKYIEYISSKSISRKTASIIFQLRVRHVPLIYYLHRFKRMASPQCPAYGHPKKTPEHFLLQLLRTRQRCSVA